MVRLKMRSCFAMETRGPVRHLSGNEYYSLREESESVLTATCDDSSLVVDKLCNQVRGKNTPVTCFYFDFAARKEQSAAVMLGSLLKQIVSGMDRIPEEISRALQ